MNSELTLAAVQVSSTADLLPSLSNWKQQVSLPALLASTTAIVLLYTQGYKFSNKSFYVPRYFHLDFNNLTQNNSLLSYLQSGDERPRRKEMIHGNQIISKTSNNRLSLQVRWGRELIRCCSEATF